MNLTQVGFRNCIILGLVISLVFLVGGFSQDVFAHQTAAYHYNPGPTEVRHIYTIQNNWMRFIPDDTLITALSIPGTHNTMADTCGTGYEDFCKWIRTQAMSLDDQLNSGIRALDIRASSDGAGFGVFHGCVSLEDRLHTDVFDVVENFLSNHPSETIIISLQEASGGSIFGFDTCSKDKDFNTSMDAFLQNKLDKNQILDPGCKDSNNSLKIKLGDGTHPCDARGKIIIMSGWDSNSNYVFGKENEIIPDSRKQNDYELCTLGRHIFGNEVIPSDLESKWFAVKEHIEKATAGDVGDQLWINYLSGTAGCNAAFIFGNITPHFVASGHTETGDTAGRYNIGLWTETDSPSLFDPFPRLRCSDQWVFGYYVDSDLDVCDVNSEGINVLAEQCIRGQTLDEDRDYEYQPRYICDNHDYHLKDRLGLVYMDYPGTGLIGAILKTNPGFEKNFSAGGTYTFDEGSYSGLNPCIFAQYLRHSLDFSKELRCLTSESRYTWDLDGDGYFETISRNPSVDVSDSKEFTVTLCSSTNNACLYPAAGKIDTAKVIVRNVPPVVGIGQGSSDLLTTTVALTIRDGSKDMAAGIEIDFDWGDNSGAQFLTQSGSNPLTHEYQKSGKYLVNVTASDKDNDYSYNNTATLATPFVLLLDHIDDLVNDGTLNIEEGNFSTSRLDTILEHIDNETYVHGCVVADVFIHEFNIFGNSALITPTEWSLGLAHIESQKAQIGCNG